MTDIICNEQLHVSCCVVYSRLKKVIVNRYEIETGETVIQFSYVFIFVKGTSINMYKQNVIDKCKDITNNSLRLNSHTHNIE